MHQQPPDYMAYLLRLWPANGERSWTWRASLENTQTGEVTSFPTLDTLFLFLKAQTAALDAPEGKLSDRGQEPQRPKEVRV